MTIPAICRLVVLWWEKERVDALSFPVFQEMLAIRRHVVMPPYAYRRQNAVGRGDLTPPYGTKKKLPAGAAF